MIKVQEKELGSESKLKLREARHDERREGTGQAKNGGGKRKKNGWRACEKGEEGTEGGIWKED